MKLLSAVASAALMASAVVVTVPSAQAQTPPTTEFEDNGGADWTSHEGELAFLEAVDAMSDRVEIEVIGETHLGRPLHLVKIGHPRPFTVDEAQDLPVQMHMCTQHGNEEAGRDGCLIAIRDLAFTDDPELIAQMGAQATIFIPTANPDGTEATTRGNALGVDLNRQHLEVDQPEVRAIGRIVRDWKPVVNVDHHEYSGNPVVYDDDLTILWPRNKNVHTPLRDMAVDYVRGHMFPCANAAGYSIDEYGLQSVSGPVGDFHVDAAQTAGDWDDGISRNAGGLRHGMGILIESYVSPNPLKPEEATTTGLQMRRVQSHVASIECTLEWMRANGDFGHDMTRESMAAKKQEGLDRSAPIYFDGQDEDTTVEGMVLGSRTESTVVQDPPFCGYQLSGDQVDEDVLEAFDVHGIEFTNLPDGGAFVSMGQVAEPVIGLLLDARGKRHLVPATGLDDCTAFTSVIAPEPAPAPAPEPAPEPQPEPAPLPVTGGGMLALALFALAGANRLRTR